MRKNLIFFVIVAFFVLILILLIAYFAYFNAGSLRTEDRSNKAEAKAELKTEFEVLVNNLDTPWALDFLPSGEMVYTERFGRVSLHNFNTGESKVLGIIDEVSEISESGLSGIAIDPNYANNHFIYVYYTYSNGNRVSRFELINSELENEVILLDNIPSARFHDGGRIKFGTDGKLYVTTGDATQPSSAQDINSLAGKILRMNSDGTIPKDNPFGNYVYSYGHRNPQGIAWNPITGELYSSEHGPTRNDEINIIAAGANYGWPTKCSDQKSIDDVKPIKCYTSFTLAPSGMDFYQGDLYVTGLKGNQLRRISFDEDYENIISEEKLFDNLGRIREVVSHEGYLYIATSNRDGRGVPRSGDDKILRIKLVE